ncbi:MAG: alcohol dehydrogenase catalytic domain-containing protein [Proteobacteria bacterium]|nr:alcohol dehydrogenase catalytic domain-containing protein [Pseudomonadota bacterium]
MRAAVFEAEGRKLAIAERETPTAGQGELVLRVAFCGICGSDLHATEPSPFPLDRGTVLGHEFAGTVAASGAAEWQVGDRAIGIPLMPCADCAPLGECREGLGILCPRGRIIGLAATAPGAYAEYVRLPARMALRVPDGLDLSHAALAEPLAVGAHAVRKAGTLLGARVLVIGAGPIGLAVIAFAALSGAGALAVSEPDPTRRERALSLGATTGIDPRAEDVRAAFAQAAGGAPDVVFECAGAPGLLRHAIDLAGIAARVVVVGVCRTEDTLLPRVAIRKELSVQFVLGYVRDDFALVLDTLAAGRLDAARFITRTIGLDALPDTFEALRRPNPEAKVLIAP